MPNPETECRRFSRHGVCGDACTRDGRRDEGSEVFRLLTAILPWCGLTPELSRTDLRHGGVVHVTAQAEPRSGLGLNELLGAPFELHSDFSEF